MTHPPRWGVEVVARTGERFASFGPFVPSISDRGHVAFQATLREGGSGVYLADPDDAARAPAAVHESSSPGTHGVVSHPDVNGRGEVCWYADGTEAGVWLRDGGGLLRLGDRHGALGPTINRHGAVAFRAPVGGGHPADAAREAVLVARRGVGTTTVFQQVCAVGDMLGPDVITAFEGLPVINDRGELAIRVVTETDGRGAGAAVGLWRDGAWRAIARVGSEFETLGRFPCLTNAGRVVFAATRQGRPGVFALDPSGPQELGVGADRFVSVRGAVADERGEVLVIGQRPGAPGLGVHDAHGGAILWIGQEIEGAMVADLALNPVSMNADGIVAARVRLDDGRELIVRASPG